MQSQQRIGAVEDFRYPTNARPKNPMIIMAQVAGSGTAPTSRPTGLGSPELKFWTTKFN